ncbi:MAG: hypothetical protein C0412_08415 [Flavobacterium sp.]|nr:hypothetical protein [Flavobacterium sp.]
MGANIGWFFAFPKHFYGNFHIFFDKECISLVFNLLRCKQNIKQTPFPFLKRSLLNKRMVIFSL